MIVILAVNSMLIATLNSTLKNDSIQFSHFLHLDDAGSEACLLATITETIIKSNGKTTTTKKWKYEIFLTVMGPSINE